MDSTNDHLSFQVLLNREMHELAQKYAVRHAEERNYQRVYLNTLAICATKFYFQCMGIKSVIEENSNYNTFMQALFDTAALNLPKSGILECRPVLAQQQKISIPIECENRIGYVFVRFDTLLKHAKILGFLKSVPIEQEFFLNELNSLEALLEELDNIRKENQLIIPSLSTANLSNWFKNKFEDNWLPTSVLFKAFNISPEYSLRSSEVEKIARGKIFKFDIQMIERQIVLLVSVKPVDSNRKIDICVQVLPEPECKLPKGLELKIIDEVNDICLQAIAKNSNDVIQQEFFAQFGERFKVELVLGDAKITENFLV